MVLQPNEQKTIAEQIAEKEKRIKTLEEQLQKMTATGDKQINELQKRIDEIDQHRQKLELLKTNEQHDVEEAKEVQHDRDPFEF